MNSGDGNNTTTPIVSYSDEDVLVRLIFYSIAMILAVILNTIAIISFVINPALRTTFNLYLFNLSFIDLITGILRIGFNVVSVGTIRGVHWPYGQALCNLNGWIQSFVYTANIQTLMIIAILRYVVVVRSKASLITKKVVIVSIIIAWIYSIILSTLPLLGWNRYRYQPLEFACLPDWTFERSYPIFLMISDFTIPMIVMIFCYSAIYFKVKRNSKRMRTISVSGANTRTMRTLERREARVTRAMFAVFATFFTCYAPYSFCVYLLSAAFHVVLSKDVFFFCGYMVNLNCVINPILYIFLYREFKLTYYQIILGRCTRFDTTSKANNSSSISTSSSERNKRKKLFFFRNGTSHSDTPCCENFTNYIYDDDVHEENNNACTRV